jgi:hypothetical protein
MNKVLKNIYGNIAALTAMSMFSLMLFVSMAVDVSHVLTARNQLQVAVDASALAGASGLLQSQAVARNRALAYAANNDCFNQSVSISPGNIYFPTASQIHVRAYESVPFYFARIIGINNIVINAQATAELIGVNGSNKFRPFAVPDMHWAPGDVVLIKSGDDKSAPSRTACWHYPVCFPPKNRGIPETGAQIYEQNIKEGTKYWIYKDDILEIEVGNMVGPTKSGVDYLVNQDPNAYWNGSAIVGSEYSGFSSPRIIKIPLFDSGMTPNLGRSELTITGFASFFVLGIQGKDVQAIFLEITTIGTPGDNLGSNSLRMVRLIG